MTSGHPGDLKSFAHSLKRPRCPRRRLRILTEDALASEWPPGRMPTMSGFLIRAKKTDKTDIVRSGIIRRGLRGVRAGRGRGRAGVPERYDKRYDSGRRGHDGGDHGDHAEPYNPALQAQVFARGGELGACAQDLAQVRFQPGDPLTVGDLALPEELD